MGKLPFLRIKLHRCEKKTPPPRPKAEIIATLPGSLQIEFYSSRQRYETESIVNEEDACLEKSPRMRNKFSQKQQMPRVWNRESGIARGPCYHIWGLKECYNDQLNSSVAIGVKEAWQTIIFDGKCVCVAFMALCP